MQEEKWQDDTLAVLEAEGPESAYLFLKNKLDGRTCNAQTYNFLYCLAAASDRSEEALAWLEEAIFERGYWYRPDVFDDTDLDSIRSRKRFSTCADISAARYREAKADAVTLSTWSKKTADRLALILHGNQQNTEICRRNWQVLESLGFQAEYIQSEHPDSYGLFRWEEGAPAQIVPILEQITKEHYRELMLCGFSAGCDEILKALPQTDAKADTLLLVSPWIPSVDLFLTAELHAKKRIRLRIMCGTDDDDSSPMAALLADAAANSSADVQIDWIDGLGHTYPDDFGTRTFRLIAAAN